MSASWCKTTWAISDPKVYFMFAMLSCSICLSSFQFWWMLLLGRIYSPRPISVAIATIYLLQCFHRFQFLWCPFSPMVSQLGYIVRGCFMSKLEKVWINKKIWNSSSATELWFGSHQASEWHLFIEEINSSNSVDHFNHLMVRFSLSLSSLSLPWIL